MLRQIYPGQQHGSETLPNPIAATTKGKKASTACLGCKQRKTKCSGRSPCEQCAQRNTPCVFDLAADQRRRIANRRNLQQLVQRVAELERNHVLLGGLIATLRAGNPDTVNDLISVIKGNIELPELAAHVDVIMTRWPVVYRAYQEITFDLDHSPRQPTADNSGSKDDTPEIAVEEEEEPGSPESLGSPETSEHLKRLATRSSSSVGRPWELS